MGLFILEKRWLWGDLTAPSSTQRGYKKVGEGLSTRACSGRTRGNGFKLFSLDIGKKLFAVIVRHWNRLVREIVDAPFVEVLKARLKAALELPGSVEGAMEAWGFLKHLYYYLLYDVMTQNRGLHYQF